MTIASELDPLIRERLQAFVARRRRLLLARGALGALAAWVGAVICVAAADLLFLLEDGVRLALSLATYALALAVSWRIAGRPLRERADLGAAARWLEAADPRLREWVLAAVELGQADAASVMDSAAFRARIQQDVAREIAGRDLRQLLPARLVQRWARLAGAALLLVVLLFALPGLPTARLLARAAWPGANLPRISHTHLELLEPSPTDALVPRGGAVPVVVRVSGRAADDVQLERFGGAAGRTRVRMKPIGEGRFSAALDADLPLARYRMRGGDAMTRKYTLTTVPAPQVLAFTKTYRYPAYTGVSNRQVREPGGALEAVEGTDVDLLLDADQPVREASLRLELGDVKSARPLEARGTSQVGTTLHLDRSGTYHVRLAARDTGFENTHSPVYEIRVTPDLVPAVELETPAADRPVAPDEVISLAGMARDDFGLGSLRQEFQVNRQGWRIAQEWPATQREARASANWDILPLGLKAGDEVLVRLSALDRRGSRGESATRRLVVGAAGASAAKRDAVAARQRVLAAMEKASAAGEALRKATEANRERLRRGREEPSIREAQAQVAAAARALDQAAQQAEQAVKQALEKAPDGTAAREMTAVGRTLSRLRRADITLAQEQLATLDQQERPEAERSADEALHRLNRAQWEPKRLEQSVEKMLAADESALAAGDLKKLAAEMDRAREAARAEDPAQRAAAERRLAASATHAAAQADALDVLAEHSNRKGDLQRLAKELREAAAKDPQQADELRNRTAHARDELRPLAAQLRREADEARRNLEKELGKRPFSPLVQAVEQLAWKRDMKPDERARQGELAEAARQSVADQLRDQAALEELRRDSDAADRRELAEEAAAVGQIRPDPADPKAAESALKDLKTLAAAHEKLEAGRDLAQAARQAQRMADDERWHAAAALERGREWPALQGDLNDLERDVRESHLPEPAARAAADARSSPEAREANDEMTRRNERQEVGRAMDRQLAAVAAKLEATRRAAEPALAEARAQVEAAAPSLAERLAAAQARAQAQREATQALAGTENAEARRDGALDRLHAQQDLNRELDAVRADLRHDAGAQDLATESGRERARDADDGLAMLREPPPRAEDLLQQAAAAGAAEQKALLEQALTQQTAAENALGMLAYHYERLEKGGSTGMRRTLRQQEQQMGVTPALDEAYRKAGKLAELQAQPPDQAAAALEQELQSNPAMQRALDRLSREELNRAREGLEQAAAGEQAILQTAERVSAERRDQAQKLQQRADDVARRRSELARGPNQPEARAALDREAGEVSAEMARAEEREDVGLREQAQRQPGLTEDVAEAAQDIRAAARHQERLGRNMAQPLGQVAGQAAHNAQNELPSAGRALEQAHDAAAARPAVEQAAAQAARRADELKALAGQLPALAAGAEQGREPADSDTPASWLARALDQADRAAASPAHPAAALARAAQAQQQSMARARAHSQVPGAASQGAPVQMAGNPGSSAAPASLPSAAENWARLRSQVAPDVREAAAEKVPEEYRAMVESYFKAVAAEARKESP